jgi:uncharacterized membrane protein YphA (DoxX/SURF4 family)
MEITKWTKAGKFAFLFCFIYIFLNTIPFPLNMYPDEVYMDGLTYKIWNLPVQWIAKNILNKSEPLNTQVNGSGDTTFHWIIFFLTIFLSIVVAFICFAIDKKRNDYSKLLQYFTIYLRFYLAYMLVFYGMLKVFCLQMSLPSLYTLDNTYGQFSPMGVLWSFVGSSQPFTIYTGCAEVLAGSLLLFRKTAFVGTLISIIIMLNVFLLNMCYDVPVKIFSFFYF